MLPRSKRKALVKRKPLSSGIAKTFGTELQTSVPREANPPYK